MFTLRPLTIVLPSQEDKDHPAIDLDLHLPFFCFRPQQLLQVLHTPVVLVLIKQEEADINFHVSFTGHFSVPVSVGAILSPAGTAGGVIFCWLGQTHAGGRELVAFFAGHLKISAQPTVMLNHTWCQNYFYQIPSPKIFLIFFPAPVMAAAICSCPGQRHAGLPHGSYCFPHGLPSEPLWGGCCCEYTTIQISIYCICLVHTCIEERFILLLFFVHTGNRWSDSNQHW